MQVPYEFDASQPYVPHEYGQAKRPLYMLDHVENQVPSVLLLATRTLQDEELRVYIEALAKECDRFEYALKGWDRE